MDFVVEKMSGFKVIGYEYIVSSETSYTDIPKLWDRFADYYGAVMNGKAPETTEEKAVAENCIGEFGICIDDIGKNKFRYLIAGAYKGGVVSKGMTVYELPDAACAMFKCIGPLPEHCSQLTHVFSVNGFPEIPIMR